MLSLGRRVCGKLKGVIRVTQRGAADDGASSSGKKSKKDKKPLFDMAKLEHPKPYCVGCMLLWPSRCSRWTGTD